MYKIFDKRLSIEQLVSLQLSARKINKISNDGASKVADCNNIDESDTNTRKKRSASISLFVDVHLKLTRGETTLLNGSSGSIASSNNNNDSSANDNNIVDTDTALVNHGVVDSNVMDELVELLQGKLYFCLICMLLSLFDLV